MKLDWKFDIPANKLICTIDDNISYCALSGGKGRYYKIEKGNDDITISYDDWPDEMRWISDNYPRTVWRIRDTLELTDEEAEEFMEVTGCSIFLGI